MKLIRAKVDMNGILGRIREAGGQAAIDRVLFGIAESTRDKWARTAGAALHTTRQAYLLGLSQAQLEGPGVAVIELVGELANALEQGKDAFSLREGLLANAKRGQWGGRYKVVPMRMSIPGTAGVVGQPMDKVYAPPGPNSRSGRATPFSEQEAKEIGQGIYAAAKRLKPGEGLPAQIGLPKLQGKHKGAPFTGMRKLGAKGHHYYVAFRTVTDRSNSFDHPGFTARNFVQVAAEHAARIAPRALAAFAKAAINGGGGAGPTSSGED